MDIYAHFSCYTKLPIMLSDVREHILEAEGCAVEKIIRYPVDINPGHLQGMLRVFRQKTPYGSEVVAHIAYQEDLEEDEMRLIVCKEMMHLLDGDEETAKNREQVQKLIEQLIVPSEMIPTIKDPSAQMVSDRIKIVHALAILLPRDALAHLRGPYHEGKISAEDISKLAKVPEQFVRFALLDDWERIVEEII